MKSLRLNNPITGISWLLITITILGGMFIVFSPSSMEFAIFIAIDLAVSLLAITIFEPYLFPLIYPQSRFYFKGINMGELNDWQLEKRVNLIDSLIKFPRQRAIYSLYINFVYKLIPTVIMVFFIWNYQESVLIRSFKLFGVMGLSYLFFASVVFIENSVRIADFIATLQNDSGWFGVLRDIAKPHQSKWELGTYHGLTIVPILTAAITLSFILMERMPFDSVVFLVSVGFIALLGILCSGRNYIFFRKHSRKGLYVIFDQLKEKDS